MLKSEKSFSELSFAYTTEFLQSDKEILSQNKMWSYVQVEKTDDIQCVENKLIAHHLNFCFGGGVYFSAVGAHTAEDFWTEIIPITEILYTPSTRVSSAMEK